MADKDEEAKKHKILVENHDEKAEEPSAAEEMSKTNKDLHRGKRIEPLGKKQGTKKQGSEKKSKRKSKPSETSEKESSKEALEGKQKKTSIAVMKDEEQDVVESSELGAPTDVIGEYLKDEQSASATSKQQLATGSEAKKEEKPSETSEKESSKEVLEGKPSETSDSSNDASDEDSPGEEDEEIDNNSEKDEAKDESDDGEEESKSDDSGNKNKDAEQDPEEDNDSEESDETSSDESVKKDSSGKEELKSQGEEKEQPEDKEDNSEIAPDKESSKEALEDNDNNDEKNNASAEVNTSGVDEQQVGIAEALSGKLNKKNDENDESQEETPESKKSKHKKHLEKLSKEYRISSKQLKQGRTSSSFSWKKIMWILVVALIAIILLTAGAWYYLYKIKPAQAFGNYFNRLGGESAQHESTLSYEFKGGGFFETISGAISANIKTDLSSDKRKIEAVVYNKGSDGKNRTELARLIADGKDVYYRAVGQNEGQWQKVNSEEDSSEEGFECLEEGINDSKSALQEQLTQEGWLVNTERVGLPWQASGQYKEHYRTGVDTDKIYDFLVSIIEAANESCTSSERFALGFIKNLIDKDLREAEQEITVDLYEGSGISKSVFKLKHDIGGETESELIITTESTEWGKASKITAPEEKAPN